MMNNMRRGGVLIVVLVMTAFVVTIAMITFEKAAKTYADVSGVHAENQGSIYVATAITAIKTLMTLDDANYDGPDDQWTVIPAIPIQGGFISVTLLPADDRIPINSLAQARTSEQYRRTATAFDNLFTYLELDTYLWHNIHDWVNPNEPDSIIGTSVSNVVFNKSGNSYSAPHRPMESLAELRFVPDMAHEYRQLANYLCMGENQPRININFASPEVISAFLPELDPYIEQITAFRSEESFKNKDDLYMIIGNKNIYTAILPYFDVKSTLLYAKIEINLQDNNHYYHVLFRRSGRSLTVLSYIEGRAIDYF